MLKKTYFLLNNFLNFIFKFFGCTGISVAMQGLSLVEGEQGLLSCCSAGLLIAAASLLQSTGSRHTDSVAVAPRL